MNSYNIYDPGRRMFWKTGGIGYTAVQSEAGIYTEEAASLICNQPYVDDYPIALDTHKT